jgi:hypothetical protein
MIEVVPGDESWGVINRVFHTHAKFNLQKMLSARGKAIRQKSEVWFRQGNEPDEGQLGVETIENGGC